MAADNDGGGEADELTTTSDGAAFGHSLDALEARLAGLAAALEATPHTRAAIVAGVVPARGREGGGGGGGVAARTLNFSSTPGRG